MPPGHTPEGDSPDAVRCDLTLIFMWEISGDPRAAEIPTKKNRRVQHSVDRAICVLRNRIERFINRLKNSRRVATRYDHTASSFLGFAMLASIRQWINFVHAA
jgi:hypothetical protein